MKGTENSYSKEGHTTSGLIECSPVLLQYTPEQSLALGETQSAEPQLLLSLQYTPEQSLALGEAQGEESGAPHLLLSLQYTPEQSLALGEAQG